MNATLFPWLFRMAMHAAVLMLILPPSPADADCEYWQYPLTSLPPGWSIQSPWSFSPSGAHVHLGYAAAGRSGNSISSCMYTQQFPIPDYSIETVLEFDHTWDLEGWYASGEYYCHVQVQASVNGDTPFEVMRYYASGGFVDSPGPLGTEHYVTDLGALAGDTLQLIFEAEGSAYPSGEAGFSVDWLVSDFSLVTGDGLPLERSSWAGIKALFQDGSPRVSGG